ncbi:hypothetical protein TBLA_0D05190 [Henningerozyma blattae CBS 6284]|uniref:Cytokinin riboside 5'-monophosphate phosphoribohydrolase n=1 Tax=Henningerozyma blattae (strain ATCC 34711 / CBS 6284 / DSM 70876 / NBRC 10599 / NRRL Y-10934 / UCD 77-7) TaxID=1071380 RepID=I2H3R0_HENB6|nr:hypothetical protein TBLA_0D05190 [Tetrapisispora blattae CBS 6284]CCH61012.1 hypothetical protein TBLA_0D05190 [Tetrapisispora blattae CBS 6284]
MLKTNERLSVCVYCGSSFGNRDDYSNNAEALGELFHQLKWRLVYGGGSTGLMGCIAKATMGPQLDGNVLGIIPDALISKERDQGNVDELNKKIKNNVENHKGSTPISSEYGETIVVRDMHTRKRLMANESDSFVAMPGGFGTLEEIMECITWSQLGIHSKPIILFNMDGFYDSLLLFLKHSIDQGFISETNGNIVQVATTPEEVIEKIKNYNPPEGRFNLNWSDEHDHQN